MKRFGLLSLTLFLFLAHVFGSAGFPLLKGAISKNGEFVVSIDYELEGATPTTKRLKSVTYRVDRREHFINHRFNVSNTYWSDSVGWKITASARPVSSGLAIPVISDDGKTMALLAIDNAFTKETVALRLCRQKDSGADLVGVYRLADLWSKEELEQQLTPVAYDHTPPWFDGSSFEFSADSRQFVVQTKTGRAVRIELEEGKVVADKP
jgi:hypothetical protein